MKISIVVSIYNVGEYLSKCLETLVKTDSRIIEIICVNDGSTDNSANIVKCYQKIDDRIKLVEKTNAGISSTRNIGINNSKGDYILFVDGDDYIYPDKLSNFIDSIENKTADIFWTGFMRNDWTGIHEIDSKTKLGFHGKSFIEKTIIPSIIGISLAKLYRWFKQEQSLNENQEFPSVWRFLYSKKIIIDNNIKFNENVTTGEDILFNLEYLVYTNKIYICNENFYCYVWRQGSLTQNSKEHFYKSKVQLVNERDKLIEQIKVKTRLDFSKEYIASLILSKIQMGVVLSNSNLKEFYSDFYKFKSYSSISSIKRAYKSLEIKYSPFKFRIAFILAKYDFNFLLFLCLFIANKLGIHIYPDE